MTKFFSGISCDKSTNVNKIYVQQPKEIKMQF